MGSERLGRAELDRVYRSKAAAELAAADAVAEGVQWVRCAGDPLAVVMAVKGLPGPAEASGGAVLDGPDGPALGKALEALGFDAAPLFATLSRPLSEGPPDAPRMRLALQIEAVAPVYVIALDKAAADDLAQASGVDALRAGAPQTVRGRTLLFVDGFEASLGDEAHKRQIWQQLRTISPPGPVW